jgi:hypothetical protein
VIWAWPSFTYFEGYGALYYTFYGVVLKEPPPLEGFIHDLEDVFYLGGPFNHFGGILGGSIYTFGEVV